MRNLIVGIMIGMAVNFGIVTFAGGGPVLSTIIGLVVGIATVIFLDSSGSSGTE